ncbi:MAG: NADPH:quinone reductase [Conexibacter sp.]|nr:NADPH:quinone reductase [Conexibacter sp.]
MPETMRAAVYDRAGSAQDTLRVTEIERPEPGPGEVRVRMRLSGVNPTDWKSRAGARGELAYDYVVPNQDGAGVIDAVGEGVDPSRLGQRVWVWFGQWQRQHGTAAEWIVVPERQAVPLPDDASFALGASMGIPALTAHRCLFADGPIEGQTVLVAGGAGAVGHYAIELAKHAGARVIATVSSAEKAKLAEAAGADVVINYREGDTEDAIRHAAPGGVDRVVEVAPGANLELDLAVLAPAGTIVSYASDEPELTARTYALMRGNVTLRFVLIYTVPDEALEAAIAGVGAALRDGALSELPAHAFGLDEIAAAHDAVEQGAVGKVFVGL